VRQKRRIATYGLCRDDAGRVLLVREASSRHSPIAWSLPGGGVQHGERPATALVREVAEETGLAAEIVALRDVVSDLAVLRHPDAVMHTDRVIYDIKITGGALRPETDGSSDLAAWVEPDRLPELPLLPYVSRLLDLPVAEDPDIPAAELVHDPSTSPARRQRFAAYGLVSDPAGRRLLLARIAEGYPGAGTWHLPGGGTDFGETATVGLLRELLEETAQRGRVTGLLAVTDYHNPRAMGPERRPMDWHTVRALYRVLVDEPGTPSVVEAAGGSTAEAAWFDRADLAGLRVNDFARGAISGYLTSR
jgi:8-oxo-dGTP diphosphatase